MSFASIVAIKRCSPMDFGSSTVQPTTKRLELDFMMPLVVIELSPTCFSLLKH